MNCSLINDMTQERNLFPQVNTCILAFLYEPLGYGMAKGTVAEVMDEERNPQTDG